MTHALSTSVIIPVRNGTRFLRDAVDSALQQLDAQDEIIVIDDRSTDGTPELVSTLYPQVVLLSSKGVGVSAARNAGLAVAKGQLVAFLDHDDWWPPNRHTALRQALADTPAAHAAYGRLRAHFEPGIPARVVIAKDNIIIQVIGTGLYRMNFVRPVGGFDEALSLAEDTDFHFRLVEAGLRHVRCDADSLIYRFHSHNSTVGVTEQQSEISILDCLRRHIMRRRQASGAS
jgi:glycosyltransferase involved in cell wall biosynthesis